MTFQQLWYKQHTQLIITKLKLLFQWNTQVFQCMYSVNTLYQYFSVCTLYSMCSVGLIISITHAGLFSFAYFLYLPFTTEQNFFSWLPKLISILFFLVTIPFLLSPSHQIKPPPNLSCCTTAISSLFLLDF